MSIATIRIKVFRNLELLTALHPYTCAIMFEKSDAEKACFPLPKIVAFILWTFLSLLKLAQLPFMRRRLLDQKQITSDMDDVSGLQARSQKSEERKRLTNIVKLIHRARSSSKYNRRSPYVVLLALKKAMRLNNEPARLAEQTALKTDATTRLSRGF